MKLFRRAYTYFKYGSLQFEVNFEEAVEDWHRSKVDNGPLHEWLGLTWRQYCSLVDNK